MPLQRTETYTSTGTKPSWNCDPSITPFQLSVAVDLLGAATATFGLQYSYDTLDSPTATDDDAKWFDSATIPAGTTADAQQSFVNTPIARIRIVIAALSGSLKMTMLQPMSVN
jgi:hypothetical protein